MEELTMENHEREEIKDFASDTLYPLFLHCAHMLGRGHHHCTASHPSQHRILSLLSEKESIPQQELLEILDIRASSLSELLSKLEEKGLITRTKPDHAKRNVNVEITDLGAAVAEEHAQHKEEAAQELFASLSEEEQKTLAGLLEKLFHDWHGRNHGNGEGHHCCHHHEGHGEGHGCGCHGGGEHHHHHGNCPHRRDAE
jgi:DNA-binding MarR family transcriptional regulator